jgi:hypothetical protein
MRLTRIPPLAVLAVMITTPVLAQHAPLTDGAAGPLTDRAPFGCPADGVLATILA